MDNKDFGYLIEQLNEIVRTTVIRIGLVNQHTADMFKALPEAQTPVGINGFELMLYENLHDDHVLFFSSREDAQEFIDACEEYIREAKAEDPKAAVGAIVALQQQRLKRQNSIIDREVGKL